MVSLKESLALILDSCASDEEVAERVVSDGLLQQILQYGAVTNEEAAGMLGYKSKRSVDSMAQKSQHFPKPVCSGVFWSVGELRAYKEKFGR